MIIIKTKEEGEMKKIFIALVMLGFLSTYSFAAEPATVTANDTVKAAETKTAETKAAETKAVKKANRKKMKAAKKAKKEAKKEAKEETKEVKQ